MNKEKFLIDGRLIEEKPTGISRYSVELIKSYIAKYGSDNVYTLCIQKNSHLVVNPVIVKYKPYNLLHYILLPFFLRKTDFTIFHSTTYSSLFFKIKNLKNIVTVHDIFYRLVPAFFSENTIVNFIAIKYYDFIVRNSIKSAFSVISVSKTTRSDLIHFLRRDSIVIPEGVNNLTKNIVFEASKKDFFLYVGNLRKQKNIQFLVDVFSDLPYEKLVVCGDLSRLDARWNEAPNIEFKGFVTDEQLFKLYKSCKAFIFPSIYEGFGLPVLEALSLNTLVFSSTGGALKELKNPNIYHFDPYVKTELIRLIEQVDNYFFDKQQADIMLKKYSWDSVLSEMHEKLEKIIKCNEPDKAVSINN